MLPSVLLFAVLAAATPVDPVPPMAEWDINVSAWTPVGNRQWGIRWADVAITLRPYPAVTVGAEIALDEPGMEKAWIRYQRPVAERTTLSLTAGRFLNPLLYAHPAPQSLEVPFWPHAINGFGVNQNGVNVAVAGETWTLRGSVFHRWGDMRTTAIAQWRGAAAFWQSDIGWGVQYTAPRWHRLARSLLGFAQKEYGRTDIFAQNSILLRDDLLFYTQLDWEAQNNEVNGFIGLTWEWTESSYVQLYRDLRPGEWLGIVTITIGR